MTNVQGIITEDIATAIRPGLTVFDRDGKRVGTVDMVDRIVGYFMVHENSLSLSDLSIPFRVVSSIDPREIFVSVTKLELHRDFSSDPTTTTSVKRVGSREIATSTQPSGYDGMPVVIDRIDVDEVKAQISIGDRVFTSDMGTVGTVKDYDPKTGWMTVERGLPHDREELLLPIALVETVDPDAREVFLVRSQEELRRTRRREPAQVVYLGGQTRPRI